MSAAKKRAGFAGDHPALGIIVVIMLLLAVAGSFGLSAHGLWLLAGEMGVEGAARALLVLTIDGLIVGTTAAILIRRGRTESTWFLWGVVFAMTLISAWANFSAHQMEGQALTPSIVGALMPITLLAATEVTLLTLVRAEGEAPDRKPRRKRTQTAAVESASASTPAVAAPAPKSAPKRATRPASAAVSLDSLSPEVAAMVDEFRAVAHDPASSEGGEVSDRMSELLLALVDDHDVRAVDLSRIAGHADAARIRARLKKARDQRNLVSV